MFKVLVIDHNDGSIYSSYVEEYGDIYTLGGFEIFDVVYGKTPFGVVSIFVDDEGLLKSGTLVSDLKNFGSDDLKLAGNLIIAGGTDDEGETLDVPEGLTIDWLVDNITVFGVVR